MVVWLVRYVGQMLNRFRRGPDCKTAYERWKGRAFQRKVPPFGEKILYQLPGVTSRSHRPTRVEPRREDGVYLGLNDRADEVYIGLSDGSVARARTIKRREATAQGSDGEARPPLPASADVLRPGRWRTGPEAPGGCPTHGARGAGRRTARTPESVHH